MLVPWRHKDDHSLMCTSEERPVGVAQITAIVCLCDVEPSIAAASRRTLYHLFWDDIDNLKLTDFKTEVLSDLVDSLYRQNHGLTVTGNYSMRDLVEHERMHPAIVRRLDDMCRVI